MLSNALRSNPKRLKIRYPAAFSVIVMLATTGIQWLAWPFILQGSFLLYYPAMVICALFGNGPVAIVLSSLLATYFFIEPKFSFVLNQHDAFFVATYMLSSVLVWQLGKAARQALEHSDEVDQHNRTLIHSLEAARHESESERNKLHSLFMQAPAIINVLEGPDHRFVLCNPASRAQIGGRDPTGLTVREALPEYNNQAFFEILDKTYDSGETFAGKEMPSKLVQPDGTVAEQYFNVVFKPVRDYRGQVSGILNLSIDVTEEVLAKRRRERLVQELNDAVIARDEFMSIASHELRTPLTSLKLQNQMRERNLQKGMKDAFSDEKLKRMVHIDSIQIERLIRLVDDMLDISRIRTGKLTIEREKFDLTALLNDVVERHFLQLSNAGCSVEVVAKEKLEGHWDRFRLEQVLANVLSNAGKYGSGKPVHISAVSENGKAVVRVKDQGRGIAPVDHERIFQRFERAISASEVSGLGLGLYISREIMSLHGGTISVESAIGQGATFTVTLPLG